MDLDVLWRQFYQMKPMFDEQFAAWQAQKAAEAEAAAAEQAEAEAAAAEQVEAEAAAAEQAAAEIVEQRAGPPTARNGGGVLQRPT